MKSHLIDFLTTDLEMMTATDWVGVIVTLVTFIAMTIAYVKVFHPKNKASLETHRYHLLRYDKEEPMLKNLRKNDSHNHPLT